MIRPFLGTLSDDAAGRLELVVSELATNAVRHARTPYEITVAISVTIRVEVTDASRARPVRQPPALLT
jgi:anti-sigma regulatory factor (Ser/Thr protein kinase)